MANGGVWRKIALFRQSLPGWLITGLAGRYGPLLRPALLLWRGLLPDGVTKQPVKERLAARIAVVSDPVRQPYRRAVVARLGSRDRDFGLPAVFLQRGEQPGIPAIEVVADLQVTGVIHKRRLVGDVDRDLVGKAQVDLGVAEHALDPVGAVAGARHSDPGHDLGVLGRVLHAHAA